MIEINLLPEEFKSRRRLSIPRIPLIPIAAACIAALLVGYLGVLVLTGLRSRRLAQFEKVWEAKTPIYATTLALQAEVESLRAQRALLDQISGKSILWARILNTLSDSLPDGVWLTRFVLKQDGLSPYVEMRGAAEPISGQLAMESIVSFVEALRADKAFMQTFERLELGSIERLPLEEEETLQFRLKAPLHEKDVS